MLASLCTLRGWPFGRHQSNGLTLPVVLIFLFKGFILSIFNCLSIIQKHLAQTCGFITLADSQTFYQMSVFNSKTNNLQMRKYQIWCQHDVISIKEYLTFSTMVYLLPPKHSLKIFFVTIRAFSMEIYKETWVGVFLNTLYKQMSKLWTEMMIEKALIGPQK